MCTRILPVCLLLAGCIEHGLVDDDDPVEAPDPGSVAGRVCDPSGRTWLPDAQVYTYLYDEDGRVWDTRQTWSDRDGWWLLEDLPSEREYRIFVQHGYEILERMDVWVGEAEDVVLDEPDCFDPLAVDVAVVTGDYDDFQDVLVSMGFANYHLVDGLDPDEARPFLLDPANLAPYDIVFFNSGFVEEDVIYDTDGSDVDGVTDSVRESILAYVGSGGSVYASDWACDVVEQVWPSRVNWIGDDEVPDDAQAGEYGLVNAAVSDAALAQFLGRDYLEVEFDLPVWPVLENVDGSVSVHLSAPVEYRLGTQTYVLPTSPILVSFTSGEGRVVASAFRVAKNATPDMVVALQYLMSNL